MLSFHAFPAVEGLLTGTMDATEPESPRLHFPISWDQVQLDSALLAKKLAAKGQWQGIVAVARGGLVPAALVARALDIRTIETVSAAAYDGERIGEPELLKFPSAAGDGTGWLLIDDLVDTGTTMRMVRGILPKAYVGVLYAKPVGSPLADVFVREFPQESWIDFPWEMHVAV
jgi:xanthine phosphoribosyltransferase